MRVNLRSDDALFMLTAVLLAIVVVVMGVSFGLLPIRTGVVMIFVAIISFSFRRHRFLRQSRQRREAYVTRMRAKIYGDQEPSDAP